MEPETIQALFAALRDERVDYVLVGALAMDVLGIGRLTEDIDLFVRPTAENIDRLRAHLGSATVPVHAIGGVADHTTPDDVEGIYRAALERHVIGGSLYDWRTTSGDLWARMQRFRA